MADPLDIAVFYENVEDGWIMATIPSVPGVFTQGRTRAEARANAIDALRLMLAPEPAQADDRDRELLRLTVVD